MLRPLLACLAIAVTTGAYAETSFDTAQGPVTLEAAPKSVAVFDVAAIDTLHALGIMPAGVIAPLFVSYLDDVTASAANVGSIFEPDLEALNALAPDLTIVGGRSSGKLEDVARVSPAADMTIWGDVVDQGYARLKTYGALFGKEAEAEALRAELDSAFAETRAALEGQGKALIVMTNGPEVSAYGPKGRFAWLHEALAIPAAADIQDSNHGESVSFEFIRETDPDILLVIDRLAAIGSEGEAAAAVLDNALVRETKAWKNDKVIYIDSGSAYIAAGGVQALKNVLASVRAGLSD